MNCDGARVASRTSFLMASEERSRRGLWIGKGI
jgi:hypothetical protein